MSLSTNKRVSYSEEECLWVCFYHTHSMKTGKPMYISDIVNVTPFDESSSEYPIQEIAHDFCNFCSQMTCTEIACFIPKYKVVRFAQDILDYPFISFAAPSDRRCILYSIRDIYGLRGHFQFIDQGHAMYDFIGPSRVMFS